ncbi:hypothetical protein BGY98DRAFT_993266 [Russula aff. rugulosa BPL654]|nr:hypothetical protein BGY98DRAFT_993266 [Russula aff. rugulosa BPL654]
MSSSDRLISVHPVWFVRVLVKCIGLVLVKRQAQSDDTCLVDGGRLQGTELQRDMVRTSSEDRAMPVAGVTLAAMDLFVTGLSWLVYTQPASVHPLGLALVLAYPCPAASTMCQAFQAAPAWKDHLKANSLGSVRETIQRVKGPRMEPEIGGCA